MAALVIAALAVGHIGPLRQLQASVGARLGTAHYADGVSVAEVPLSFGDTGLPALQSALADHGVLLDRSHWRVLRLSGADRRRFLHSQCTNELAGAPAGALLDACALDAQGRTIDLVTVADVPSRDELLVIASPNRGERLAASFERLIFPLDKVRCELEPHGTSALLECMGPAAHGAVARALSLQRDQLPPPDRAAMIGDVLVLGSGSLSRVHGSACVLLAPAARAAHLWRQLSGADDSGGRPPLLGGEREWQALRIACGRPFPDAELTRETNPLEAGLYHTVSFRKGCYIGQETVSKVNAAPAPKQRLFGLRLDRPLPPGAALFAEGEQGEGAGARAGVVTSMLPDGQGLALIRSAVGTAGLRVRGKPGAEGEEASRGAVLDVPFASRSEAQSAAPREAVASGAPAAEASADAKALAAAAAAAEAEAARKAAKLAAMQARFDAFKAGAAAKPQQSETGGQAG